MGRNIFATTDEGERAWTLTKEGHIQYNSIGYRVDKYTDIEPGKKRKIQGREYVAPDDMVLRISTKWQVAENSAVIIPADKGAKNRTEIKQNNTSFWKGKIMFEQWLKERGIDIESLTDAQRAALEEDFKAIGKAPENKPDDPPVTEPQRATPNLISDADQVVANAKEKLRIEQEALKAERARVEAIQELGKPDVPDEVIETCIREGKTIEESQGIFLSIIKNNRAAIDAPAIQIRDVSVEKDDIVAG
ncbi:MAG: hypothetical protein ACYS8Z_23745, partial [Planctomycetota bacterium]